MPGIIVRRQFATCLKVLKLSSRTITLASEYFAFDFFGSKTVPSELNIIACNKFIFLIKTSPNKKLISLKRQQLVLLIFSSVSFLLILFR